MDEVDDSRLAELIERARRDVEDGLLPACQLAVARHGELVADVALGDTDGADRFPIMSCTKALIAAAVWLLMGERHVRAEDPVMEFIPEFGAEGKEPVTVEHLLTHTAGFPHAPLPPAAWEDRAARVDAFSRWRLTFTPGTRCEYHATSAHWVLAEIIARVAGVDHREFVNGRVLDALGLHRLRLGVPVEDQHDIVDLASAGSPPSPAELEAVTGLAGLDLGEVNHESILRFNEPAARAAGVPGAGAVGTAADVALFYQALLHNPGGLWDDAVLKDGTGRIRVTHPDGFTGLPANRSLGLVIAGDDGYAYTRASMGKTVSSAAFGHEGVGGQIAWADPATGISFCYLTTGIDADLIRAHRRGTALSSRAGALIA